MLFLKFKKYASNFLLPLLLFFFLGYISYHTFVGDSGLSKNSILKNQLDALHVDLALVKEERLLLEKHISLLEKNIDADMLQEKAKKILYYAHPDEIIIIK
jgi:Septum formation initiator|tara:strand:- start:243 stop:545 length:303 start_codon:yes stop_codon:yes gene_type:complete